VILVSRRSDVGTRGPTQNAFAGSLQRWARSKHGRALSPSDE